MVALSEELSIMLSCFRESQLQATTHFHSHSASSKGHKMADTGVSSGQTEQAEKARRRYEVCFKHAEWRMTEADGQIGIAYLVLSNFLYTKVSLETDSGWHLIELGDFKVSSNTFQLEAILDVLQNSLTTAVNATAISCFLFHY